MSRPHNEYVRKNICKVALFLPDIPKDLNPGIPGSYNSYIFALDFLTL